MMMKTEYKIEHMIFTLFDDPVDGSWFALRPATEKKQLFSGPIHAGMGDQLKALSKAITKIEPAEEPCRYCDGSGWIEDEKMKRVSGEYQAYEPVEQRLHCEECNPLGV